MPLPGSIEGLNVYAQMEDLRQAGAVSITAAGLNVLGLMSHELCSFEELGGVDQSDAEMRQRLYDRLKPLKDIDWSRAAQIWAGNIVAKNDKGLLVMKTQTSSVKAASVEVLKIVNQGGGLS